MPRDYTSGEDWGLIGSHKFQVNIPDSMGDFDTVVVETFYHAHYEDLYRCIVRTMYTSDAEHTVLVSRMGEDRLKVLDATLREFWENLEDDYGHG